MTERERHEKHVWEVTCMDLPLDWDNVFDKDVRTQDVHFNSISDALIYCLTTLGKVDIEFIVSVTGVYYKNVIHSLKGSIFQKFISWGECFYKGWEDEIKSELAQNENYTDKIEKRRHKVADLDNRLGVNKE